MIKKDKQYVVSLAIFISKNEDRDALKSNV